MVAPACNVCPTFAAISHIKHRTDYSAASFGISELAYCANAGVVTQYTVQWCWNYLLHVSSSLLEEVVNSSAVIGPQGNLVPHAYALALQAIGTWSLKIIESLIGHSALSQLLS